MCARLGVEASDLVAAVACHSSGLHQVHETLVGSRNLSAFFTIGTLDGNALDAVNAYLIAIWAGRRSRSCRSIPSDTRPDPANQDAAAGKSRFVQSQSGAAHRRDRVRP